MVAPPTAFRRTSGQPKDARDTAFRNLALGCTLDDIGASVKETSSTMDISALGHLRVLISHLTRGRFH